MSQSKDEYITIKNISDYENMPSVKPKYMVFV